MSAAPTHNKESEHKVSGNLFDWNVLTRLFAFIRPYRSFFILQIIISFTVAALAVVKPILIQKAIDVYIPNAMAQELLMQVLALVGVLLLHAMISYGNTYLADWMGQNIIRDIRIRLYSHLVQFRSSYFDKTPIGRLVTRNISDVEALTNFTSEGLAGIFSDFLQIIFILVVMFYMSWKLTLLSLCTLPLMLLSTYVFKEKIKSSFQAVRVAVGNLNTFVQEHLTGMMVVQLFNREQEEMRRFKEINREHRNANLRSVFYYSIYFPVAEIIGALGVGTLLWFGASEVLNADVKIGTLVVFTLYLAMFFRPIRMIADRFNTLQMAVVSADRILQLLDTTEETEPNGTHSQEKVAGEVTFDHVWFSYLPEEWVLRDLSFSVPAGGSLALVGPTGAGKSSIIQVLTRFYEYQKGTITLDGTDLRNWDNRNLRKHIGLVQQDVFLFTDSLRNNISLGNAEISDDVIHEAIQKVGADFIYRMPGGLDFRVQERGNNLSAGQRQLITFVRTMVYNPSVLILDEATAHIDPETEAIIQKAMHTLMLGRTSIIIAHRLSTIRNADQIIVLEKGLIAEKGNHEDLLRQNGLYARMHRLQFEALNA
jgi:ATP-binding cassette, subfamily B, multidrug efflux pump